MDRPRRNIKQTSRVPVQLASSSSRLTTSKNNILTSWDPEKQLKTLLQSPKSDLVSVDMSEIINPQTWAMLSDESKDCLLSLLPTPAFVGFKGEISDDHPISELLSEGGHIGVHEPLHKEFKESEELVMESSSLNHRFFTDSHFLAAMRTFQDHLSLNWFSETHQEKLNRFTDGVANGTLSAPWKDEVWEREHSALERNAHDPTIKLSTGSNKHRFLAEITLPMLVKKGIICVGDVLSYKRSFVDRFIVEKDCIIESTTRDGVTVLVAPGTSRSLPAYLLSNPPQSPPCDTPNFLEPRSATITFPSALEHFLLDTDGRVEKSKRGDENAWKLFSVWRWQSHNSDERNDTISNKGGRESYGTLFYLLGSFYNEQ